MMAKPIILDKNIEQVAKFLSIATLTDSANPRDYWFKMKLRVKDEDKAELSTICRQLKSPAPDGKMRLTDCAHTEGMLSVVRSKANLRDNMTDLELIFTMLGEKVTTEISSQEKPNSFEDNKKVARRGGKVAGNARKDTEKELGRSIISKTNHLNLIDRKKLNKKHKPESY